MKVQVLNWLYYILYAVLLLMLFAYAKIGVWLYNIARTHFTLHFLIFSYVFPVVFGITLFTRFYISTKTNLPKPLLVRTITLFLTTLIALYIYRYSYFLDVLLYCTLLWTEVVCEFLPWTKLKPPSSVS